MKLQELLNGIEIIDIAGERNVEITGVVSDHREVKPGYAFICYEGLKVDGHRFIAGAIQNGAQAIIAEKQPSELPTDVTYIRTANGRRAQALCAANWHKNPAKRLKLIGVTGTNGKTSTAHLTYGILKAQGLKAAVLGTVGHTYESDTPDPASNNARATSPLLKSPTTINIPAHLTTPDAFQLHGLLKQIADTGIEYVVMETSSQGLAQHRLAGLTYHTAVFTNLTQDHLDYHGTMENYFAAKLMLFTQLHPEGVAILNADSPATPRIAKHLSHANILQYGVEADADLQARDIAVSLKELAFTAVQRTNGNKLLKNSASRKIRATIHLLGNYNVYNALAAIGVGMRYNCTTAAIRHGLAATVVPGRFELVNPSNKTEKDFAVIVDYAHTPDGLENVLTAARNITDRKLIAVFGCGGDRDREKRPKMGKISVQLADLSVITSDNPRTENPNEIIKDIVSNLPHGAAYLCISERREAIQYAIAQAKPGDIVVIAGKGHEDYQEIHGERFPFDDRKVAAECVHRN